MLLTKDNGEIISHHKQQQIYANTTRIGTVVSSSSSLSTTTEEPVRKKTQNTQKKLIVIHHETRKLLKVDCRKCVTQLSQKYYNNICDTSLCHLLCISGYGPDEVLEENIECFHDVMALLLGIKAWLLHQTKITEHLEHAATMNNDDKIDANDCEIKDISLDGIAGVDDILLGNH